MRHLTLTAWISVLLLATGFPGAKRATAGDTALSPSPGVEEPSKRATAAGSMPAYHPPKRGVPGGRVGGGTRGSGDEAPTLAVLAPDHVGLTTHEQPTLYWYLSKPAPYPIELAIVRSLGVQPLGALLETRLPSPTQPGIQAIRLADFGVKLAPGEQYQWFVTLVVKADRRSKDIVAGGFIERVGPPEAIQSKLDQAGKESAAHVYAETGLWYDAVMALSAMIEAAPDNGLLRKQRAALMRQVGLTEVAKYDLKQPAAE